MSAVWRGCMLAANHADFWHAAHDFARATLCGLPLDERTRMSEGRVTSTMRECPACARAAAGIRCRTHAATRWQPDSTLPAGRNFPLVGIITNRRYIMNNTTTHMTVTEALAAYDRNAYGQAAFLAGKHLADAVRAELAPLPEGEAGRMAAEAERAARTMAPPVPGITTNAEYTVRAVIHMHNAEPGLLEAWLVAAEDAGRGAWVTWNAYALDHPGKAGQLSYDAGHYFDSPARACRDRLNRQRALADLAARAGLLPEIAQLIADEMAGTARTTAAEDRRAARRIRAFFAR